MELLGHKTGEENKEEAGKASKTLNHKGMENRTQTMSLAK